MHRTRPAFTHSALLSRVRAEFNETSKNTLRTNGGISLSDCLMSGLAIFSLKYKSLLKFEEDKASEDMVKINLQTLYGVKKAPCDTYLRERLDDESLLMQIRQSFASLLSTLQRSRVLEDWKFLDNKFLISLDGSGFFSSTNVHCKCCCEKVTNKGTDKEETTYHHQMLVGSIVSPSMKQVLPIGFEPIVKADGAKKNDCERNCAKRWMEHFRKEHPKLPTVIVADGLYSNAPFIRTLQDNRCSYIIVAKEDDHKHLYDYFFAGSGEDICEFEKSVIDDKKIPKTHKYRFMNNVPLNDSNAGLNVNVLHFIERNHKKNKETKWLWVTDILITKDNAKSIMQAGRSRWKIENETFNTLKNQGYNFEHNFGHGYNGLSNVFAGLMLLAFYVDQILEACNLDFQAVLKKCGSRANTFEKIRGAWFYFTIESFESLYKAILDPPKGLWLR
jgi:hypothetical protein